MAGQAANYGDIHSFIAGAAIPAYSAVKQDATAGQVIVTTAIADDVTGFALNTAAAGEQVSVLCGSGKKVKAIASTAVARGAQVMPTAAGAGKVMTAAGATAKSCGLALSASAADGEVIEVLTRFSANGPLNA